MSKDELTWKVFSIWFRQSKANQFGYVRCCTCSWAGPWQQADTGHWKEREWKGVKYHPFNLGVQCRVCNRMKGGRPDKMKIYIQMRHGKAAAEFVEKNHTRLPGLSNDELDWLRQYCRDQMKR